MKAIRVSAFGDPSVLRLEVCAPLSPTPREILVRLHAAGVNPVEAYVRGGKYTRLPNLPYTPGSDGAGVVLKSLVPAFPAGTRVFVTGSSSGTYAEEALCPATEVYPLPGRVSFEQGAALGVPYGTATWAMFNRGQARGGETVLVHGGSGGVGTTAIQLARAAGLRILATAGTSEGLALVKLHGAEVAFNHHEPGYLDQIKAVTDGRGVDIILEMAANLNLGHDLPLLAKYGRVVVIGSRGPVEIDARNLMIHEADIRGITFFSPSPAERAEIFGRIVAGLESGALDPAVGEAFPLAEAARAHERVMSPGALGKIVLTM
jgi:NADPH2:quinone reductase